MAFPVTATVGQTYLKYFKHPPDYGDITIVQKFEDGGADFVVTAASAPQKWTLEYDGLTETQAKVLDDFYASMGGQLTGFTFVEPRDYPWTQTTGTSFSDVHFLTYEKSHEKYSVQSRKMVLIKRPA